MDTNLLMESNMAYYASIGYNDYSTIQFTLKYVDCATVTNANGYQQNSASVCACDSGYSWNSVTSTCDLNCSSITNADGFEQGSTSVCACDSGYSWNFTLNVCQSFCDYIQNAISSSPDPNQCICNQQYFWNDLQTYCQQRQSLTPVIIGGIIGGLGGFTALAVTLIALKVTTTKVADPAPTLPTVLNPAPVDGSAPALIGQFTI